MLLHSCRRGLNSPRIGTASRSVTHLLGHDVRYQPKQHSNYPSGNHRRLINRLIPTERGEARRVMIDVVQGNDANDIRTWIAAQDRQWITVWRRWQLISPSRTGPVCYPAWITPPRWPTRFMSCASPTVASIRSAAGSRTKALSRHHVGVVGMNATESGTCSLMVVAASLVNPVAVSIIEVSIPNLGGLE